MSNELLDVSVTREYRDAHAVEERSSWSDIVRQRRWNRKSSARQLCFIERRIASTDDHKVVRHGSARDCAKEKESKSSRLLVVRTTSCRPIEAAKAKVALTMLRLCISQLDVIDTLA